MQSICHLGEFITFYDVILSNNGSKTLVSQRDAKTDVATQLTFASVIWDFEDEDFRNVVCICKTSGHSDC